MSTREELATEFASGDWTETATGKQVRAMNHELYDSFLAGYDAAHEWHEDVENAPKSGDEVLIVHKGRVLAAHSFGDGWYSSLGNYCCYPTHWMPLPNPPARKDTT